MKNILILLDIEGIIGIENMTDIEKNREKTYEQLICTIRKIREFEILDRIVIADIHNRGEMLEDDIIEKMNVELIRGIQNLIFQIDQFEYALMIGFHCKRYGGGKFPHTFRQDFIWLKYGLEELGEVGIFYRWLTSKKINVIFISGEGDFKSEIDKYSGVIFQVLDTVDTNVIYKNYMMSLEMALREKKEKYEIFQEEKIIIKVNNKDKYKMLKIKGYKINKNGEIEFISLDEFFLELYRLAIDLNEINLYIYQENLKIVNCLNSLNLPKKKIYKIIEFIKNKDILDIDEFDRTIIKKRIEKRKW